jgi:hypothetical protein
MASTFPPLDLSTPIDPAGYAWKQSHDTPSLWRRRALAGDSLWLARPNEVHDMFISASLILDTPLSLSALEVAAKRSWQRLRFEVPELGVDATCGEDGVPYLQYQIANDQTIAKWTSRTFAFERSHSALEFQKLRDLIISKKRAQDLDMAFLLFRVETAGDSEVVSMQLMLNVDHQATDGIGIRIILGKYLNLLASLISDPASGPNYNWQESHKNLSPPWIAVMNEHQAISGPSYDRASGENRDALLDTMVILHSHPNSIF